MSENTTRNFPLFVKETLRPLAAVAANRKRRCLFISLGAGAVAFVLGNAGAHFFLLPYSEFLKTHGVTSWPLLILPPASIAVIAFCIFYILGLHGVVAAFRREFFAALAAYIHPALEHDVPRRSDAEREWKEFPFCLFNDMTPADTDRFTGIVDGIDMRFSSVRHVDAKSPGSGVFFQARFGQRFSVPVVVILGKYDASRSGIEASLAAEGDPPAGGLVRLEDKENALQLLVPAGREEEAGRLVPAEALARLEMLRQRHHGRICVAAHGNRLGIAMAVENDGAAFSGAVGALNLDGCMEFCHTAVTCVELACEIASREPVAP